LPSNIEPTLSRLGAEIGVVEFRVVLAEMLDDATVDRIDEHQATL
jgi:hypothetical protein